MTEDLDGFKEDVLLAYHSRLMQMRLPLGGSRASVGLCIAAWPLEYRSAACQTDTQTRSRNTESAALTPAGRGCCLVGL